jgi:hypothetical protein
MCAQDECRRPAPVVHATARNQEFWPALCHIIFLLDNDAAGYEAYQRLSAHSAFPEVL